MKIKHKTRNAKSGFWTALISHDGLEVLTKGTSKKLRKSVKGSNRFLMKIRPMRNNLEGLFRELNSLRNISREVALQALDVAIENGCIEIVGYDTGDREENRRMDSIVMEDFGLVMER